MPKYRKKPVEIEAEQWDGTATDATRIIDWVIAGGGTATYACSDPDRCAEKDGDTPHHIAIRTLEGTMNAGLGDWIIRGVQGEFYPCRGDIFETTYELVTDSTRPQVEPHPWERLGWRWWLCRHCYAPRALHPRAGWVVARRLGDHRYISSDAPHFTEGW